MGAEKKFTTAEIIVGSLFLLLVDGAAFVLDLFLITTFVAMLIQAGASLGTTLWLKSKGSKKATKLERQMIKQASNVLPWVPTCAFAFWIEVVLHNNPKFLMKFAKKSAKISK